MATKKKTGKKKAAKKESEAPKKDPYEVPMVGPYPSPIDAALYEGPRVPLEGEMGIPEVDAALKEGIDPASSIELMAKVDSHYSNDDLIRMVTDGEVETENLEDRESPLSEDNMAKFVMGEITWGQLQGITMEEAYAFAEIGYTQFEQGRYDDAQAIFEGLVISNPYDAYFHTMLGAIYARKDMQEEAAEEYTIALELDPENIAAYVNRAEILLQHGEFEIAMDDLKNAIKLDTKGEDPSGIRARALAAATAAIIEEILEQRGEGAAVGAEE